MQIAVIVDRKGWQRHLQRERQQIGAWEDPPRKRGAAEVGATKASWQDPQRGRNTIAETEKAGVNVVFQWRIFVDAHTKSMTLFLSNPVAPLHKTWP